MPIDFRLTCDCCGVQEHVELMDCKPEPVPGFWAKVKLWWAGMLCEGGDISKGLTRFECIACYGPAWEPASSASIAKSIAPALKPYYESYARRDDVAVLMAMSCTPWA